MSQNSQFWLCLFLDSFWVVITLPFSSVQGSRTGDGHRDSPSHPTALIDTQCPELQIGSTHSTSIAGPDLTQKPRAESPGRLRSPLPSAPRTHKHQIQAPACRWAQTPEQICALSTCSAHGKDPKLKLLRDKKWLRSISFLESSQQCREHPEHACPR